MHMPCPVEKISASHGRLESDWKYCSRYRLVDAWHKQYPSVPVRQQITCWRVSIWDVSKSSLLNAIQASGSRSWKLWAPTAHASSVWLEGSMTHKPHAAQ